jgi:hypothetical protein
MRSQLALARLLDRGSGTPLEHDPEKWKPVFRKDHAQTKRRDHRIMI